MIQKDDLCWIAWEKFKETNLYKNIKYGVTDENHTEGCLWATFHAGHKAKEND